MPEDPRAGHVHPGLMGGRPADEPTEADPPWRLVRLTPAGAYDPPDNYEPDSTIDYAQDRSGVWYEDEDRPNGCIPLYRIAEERALVGGRSVAPTRDEVEQRLTDAQQHNEALKAERDEARATVVEARDILDALIEWFGAPDWSGPDLPVELGRRIATLLGPRSAMDRVRAPWALLSRSAAPTRDEAETVERLRGLGDAMYDAAVAWIMRWANGDPPSDGEVEAAQRRAAVAESIYQRHAEGWHAVLHECIQPPCWNRSNPDDTEDMTAEQVAWMRGEPLPGGVAAEPNKEAGE